MTCNIFMYVTLRGYMRYVGVDVRHVGGDMRHVGGDVRRVGGDMRRVGELGRCMCVYVCVCD